jgi:secreted trypsin-like serine protease
LRDLAIVVVQVGTSGVAVSSSFFFFFPCSCSDGFLCTDMSFLAPAPTAVSATKRLVRKKRDTNFVLVFFALAAVLALLAVIATFPLVVRRATEAVVAARAGTGRSAVFGVDEFVGRRLSPFLVTVENAETEFQASGTLVQDVFVLTAAHNVAQLDDLSRATDVITSPARLTVSIREKWSLALQTRRVVKVCVHKAFSSGVGSPKLLDVAMLQLERAFDARTPDAPDYWESATLAGPSDWAVERHGTITVAGAFGRMAATRERVRVAGPDFVAPSASQVVMCGDPEQWLQNNSTLCFAPRSNQPPQVCSGDTGGPLAAKTGGGKTLVMGIIVTGPAGCQGEHTAHRWGVALSVIRLRDWIDAIVRGKPFGATEATTSALIDHDAWRDGDSDGEVYCTDKGTFRVVAQGAKADEWRARHCSSGREVNVAKTALTRCDKPCSLQRVRTTDVSLEIMAESDYEVVCSKSSRAAYRATGRTEGFQVSNSVRREVQSCAGGVPEWLPADSLEPCPESACLATPPVDFESSLEPVCDRLGNAALLTGQRQGWFATASVFVPVYFQDKRQVVPCHGGPAQWLYEYWVRPCSPAEVARCRGPEGTPRTLSGAVPVSDAPPTPVPETVGLNTLDEVDPLF